MNAKLFSVIPVFENISKLFSIVIKTCLALGCSLVVSYLVRIGYFPQGLSLGDGLLFLMVAIPFGVFYALFLYSILSLGVALYWSIKRFFRCYTKLLVKKENIFDLMKNLSYGLVWDCV